MRKQTKWKTVAVMLLAFVFALQLPAVTEAYEKAPNETMYLKGVEEAYTKEGTSYLLLDVDGDETNELLVAEKAGKNDTLTISLYDEASKTAALKKTIKKVKAVYSDPEGKRIVVVKKASPADTYTEFSVEDHALKTGDVYKAKKKNGKVVYYRNKKKITAKKYKAYKKNVRENLKELVFYAPDPWAASDVIGVSETLGEGSEKDDFHAYANYAFLKEEHIKTAYEYVSTLSRLEDMVKENEDKLFEDRKKYTGKDFDIINTFYDKATDYDSRNSAGVEPLRKYIEDVQSCKTMDDLSELMADPKRNPYAVFFTNELNADPLHAEEWILSIGLKGIPSSISSPYKISNKELVEADREDFSERVRYILGRLGMDEAEIDQYLKDSFRLEDAVFPAVVEEEEMNEEEMSAKIRNLSELTALSPSFPFQKILEGLGVSGGRVLFAQTDYLKALDEKYTEENLSLFKGFLIVQNAVLAGGYLDFEAEAVVNGYASPSGSGVEYTEEKDHIRKQMELGCRDMITNNKNGILYTAFENCYMKAYVDPETKASLTKMVQDIMESFRELLSEEEWMSEEGRKACLKKLDAMDYFVMSPDEPIDTSYLMLDTAVPFLDAMIELNAVRQRHILSMVGKPVARDVWWYDLFPNITTTSTNAAYDPTINRFIVYAGFVGEETFTPDMSEEEKLGKLGVVIGHEITHGFDPRGSKYDEVGNLVSTKEHPNGWMPIADYELFQQRIRKVEAYYDNLHPIPIDGLHYKGSLRSGESIADMGGMAITLNIAKKRPGFDYDKYFKAYADLWKKQNSIQTEIANFEADVHPLCYLRVNTTVQQFDEFLETYGIKEGDRMYLKKEDRMVVW